MKRYADDVVVHCHSERMAYRARSRPRLMEWTHPHFNGVT